MGGGIAMKSTGIVRKVDELGRIVLPIELRRTLEIAEKDSLEIYVDGSSIVLKKYEPSCVFCNDAKNVLKYLPELSCGTQAHVQIKGNGTMEFHSPAFCIKRPHCQTVRPFSFSCSASA